MQTAEIHFRYGAVPPGRTGSADSRRAKKKKVEGRVNLWFEREYDTN